MIPVGPDPAGATAKIAYEDLTLGRKFDLGTVEIDREDWPEYLLLSDAHIGLDAGEDRGFHEPSAIEARRPAATDHEFGALLQTDLDVVLYDRALSCGGQRADLG